MSIVNTSEKERRLRALSDNRIQINSVLSGLCVAILTVLLALPGAKPGNWVVGQLASAVPVLVTSSLAYAKLKYRDEDEMAIWNTFGWLTHSVGYIMILNAMVIMLYRNGYPSMAWLLLALIIVLFAVYSILDVIARQKRSLEKGLKALFYVLVLLGGTVFPLLLGCI
jgi:L-asparagine transporter-like permease